MIEAHKRCGSSEEACRRAAQYADFHSPNLLVDQEMSLLPGVTAEDVINELVRGYKRLQALTPKQQDEFLAAIEERQRREARKN